MEERLQKVLARAGVASRRQCETLIREGRVTVDGVVVTELGTKVDPARQEIAVDGRVVSLERPVCVMLHKPTSYVTTVRDPQGRRTVMDLVADVGVRLYPVGRLDYDSSGLLLLSNDGDLTYRLLHPSRHVDKTYRVTVLGIPDKEGLQRLRRGIELEDGPTQPAQVKVLRQHPLESVLEITLHEGRHRQVRRMMDAIGCPVKRLKRVSFGPLVLGDLPPGRWRMLTPEEWAALYTSVDLPVPPYPGEEKAAEDRRDRPRRSPAPRKGRKS